MRLRNLALSILGILVGSGTARADTISLIWQGSGTATINAAPSATITANLVLNVTSPGVILVGIDVEWDLDSGDELDFVSSFCDPGWGPALGGVNLCILGQGDTAANPGYEGTWAGGRDLGLNPGTVTMGTITFHVTSNVATDGIDVRATFDNTITNAGCIGDPCNSFILSGASVNVVPEPGTLALLALGLGGLGFARRLIR